MKIILINPQYKSDLGGGYEKYFIRSGSRWPHSGVKKIGTLPHYIPFPFFLAYAAALLKKDGFEVKAVDCVALDLGENKLLEYLSSEQPDFIFYETTTPTISLDTGLAEKIGALLPGAKIILGGAHATVFSKETLAEHPRVFAVVKNEYEETLAALLKALRDKTDLKAVRGITFSDAGVITETERPLPIDPLDKLPEPARELFPGITKSDPTIYWDGFCQYRPAVQMHATRGCPYRCDFCLWNQVMYSNGKYRSFSVKRVVDEMAEAKEKYGAREIYFDDDDFTINKSFVKELCEEIIRRNLGIHWSCMGDAINPDKELLELMAKSGCVGLKFGVETGSRKIISRIGKPLDLDRIKEIVKVCGKLKIKTHATFTLGLPEDDRESIDDTIRFMEKLEADTIQLSICTPFPGTRFFDYAKKNGLILTDNWEKYDGKASDVVLHKEIDIKEVEELRRKALKRWLIKRLLSPYWLKKQAYYFFRTFNGIGPAFFIKQVVSIITDEIMLQREPSQAEK